jgi:hypothetical protein
MASKKAPAGGKIGIDRFKNMPKNQFGIVIAVCIAVFMEQFPARGVACAMRRNDLGNAIE